MVKALALVALLAGTARADSSVGWDFGVGALPAQNVVFGIGVDLDQRIGGAWHATAAFRWQWTIHTLYAATMTTESSAGPAIELGVRHRLTSHEFDRLDLDLDGEAGIGTQREAYAGLRFGYRITEQTTRTAQRGFDFDVGLRAIAIDHDATRGLGGMFVMAMAWDD